MTRDEALKILRKDSLSNLVYYYSSEELQDAIDTIVSQPSLPSNLDKAAHEFEDKAMSDYDYISVTEDGIKRPVLKYSFTDAFKAGAEWMAGQGYTFETIMQEDDVDELVPTCPDMYNHGYSCSDKVIVQIRKKQ